MIPRRFSGWRIAAIVLGILALVAAGLVIEIRSSADRAWKVMEDRTRELIAESNARTTTRAVLRGTPEPGNAWECYDEALNRFTGLTRSEVSKLTGFAERAPAEDRAVAEKLLSTHGAIIPIVRRGTQRSDITFHYDWEERTGPLKVVRLPSAQALATLMVCEARLVREKGLTPEATRLLLDTIQFSNDLQRRGLAIDLMAGIAMLKAPFDELRLIAQSRELISKDLAELDLELEILDRDWPLAETMQHNENLYFRCALLRVDDDFGSKLSAINCWRYGFSPKLMITNAVAKRDSRLEDYVRYGRGPWSELVREDERIKKELQSDPNPLAPFAQMGSVTIHGALRYRHAQIRMLRIALRHRLDGSRLDMDDPFGTKLRAEESGAKLKIWSVGRDAVDHHGAGEWNDLSVGPRDIVLEIDK